MNIKIYKKNFDLTEPFRQYLQEKFKLIEKYKENIISFVIDLSRDQHHNKGEVFTIVVHVSLPNKQNIILKETNSDARIAVDSIQEKLIRQLTKYKEKNSSKIRKNIRRFKSLKFWQKK